MGAFLPLVACTIYADALNKGTPLSPIQIRFASDAQRDAVNEVDESVRAKYWRLAGNENHMQSLGDDYVSGAAQVLSSDINQMRRFSGISDFFNRASITAWVDVVLTAVAGTVVLIYVLFLLYLVLKRNSAKLSEKSKDYMLIGYAFIVTWFPFRMYAIWYQNFYTFNGTVVDGLVVATTVAIVGGVLLVVLFKRGVPLTTLSAISSAGAALIGFIARLKPEWLIPVGIFMNELTVETFIVIESIVIASLLVFVWPYLPLKMPEGGRKL